MNNTWTIKQPLNCRHIKILGKLTINNIIIDGVKSGGGLLVEKTTHDSVIYAALVIESGAIIQNCYISNLRGGGLVITGGDVIMYGGAIRDNLVKSDISGTQGTGGGVWINQGSFTMYDGEISGNSVIDPEQGTGGGIAVNGSSGGSTLIIYGGTISDNTASHRGGGIYTFSLNGRNNNLEIYGGDIINNESASGGGIFTSYSTIVLNNISLKNNKADRGGGLYLYKNSNVVMRSGEISNNKAASTDTDDGGGGVYVAANAAFTMETGLINNNEANSGGGGVCIDTNAAFTMENGQITGNKAYGHGGGGVLAQPNSSFTMNAGTISGNQATYGGGIKSDEGQIVMNNATISGNKASRDGGGVFITNDSLFTMNSGKITENEALTNGGGVYVSETADTLKIGSQGSLLPAPEITGNKAAQDGGGIWTADYAKLQIASNAVFGKYGTSSANIAAPVPDYWSVQADYTAAFQTRFTTPTGIYSPWAQNYSTTAVYHPVNNCDINVISHTVTVFYMDDSLPPGLIDSDPPSGKSWRIYQVGDGVPFKLDGSGDRIIPEISGYIFKDWGIDSFSSLKGNTTVSIPNVTDATIIYLIYMEIPTTTLTVSKQVAGVYALQNKSWEFTVYFTDDLGVPLPSGTKFDYTISYNGLGPSPQTGELELDSGGSAKFYLKHDQKIVINDVSLSSFIRIVAETDEHYITTYTDSNDPTATPVFDNDTGGSANTTPVMLAMSENREFMFKNTMREITETGVVSNTVHLFGLTMLAGTSGFMYIATTQAILRLKRSHDWKKLFRQ